MKLKFDHAALIAVALLSWVAHFWFFRSMGLYEDDYSFVGRPMTWDLGDFLNYAVQIFSSWAQGRPIGNVGPRAIAFVSSSIGGLPAVYIAAWLMIAVNGWLFYRIMLRVCDARLALLAATLFILWPADLTKTLLTHALQLHLSMFFLLAGSLLYLKDRRVTGYVVATGALLSYESAFLPFIVLPLLQFSWNRRWARRAGVHVLVTVGIIALAGMVRILVFGEERAVDAAEAPMITVVKIASGLFMGAGTSLGAFLWRPLDIIRDLTPGLIIMTVVAAVLIVSATLWFANAGKEPGNGMPERWRAPGLPLRIVLTPWIAGVIRLTVFGLVFALIAYALSFTHYPPVAMWGRATSVHLASAFGGAMVGAGLLGLLAAAIDRAASMAFAGGFIGIYLAILTGCGLAVQADFVRAWQAQKEFWAEVLSIAPDLGDSTLVFVPEASISNTRHVKAFSWATPLTPEVMYEFPETWSRPPRVFIVHDRWRWGVHNRDGRQYWKMPGGTWKGKEIPLYDEDLIYLTRYEGKLIRHYGNLGMPHGELKLRGKGEDRLRAFKRTPVGDLILASPGPLD